MAVTGPQRPDWRTISDFRKRHLAALAGVGRSYPELVSPEEKGRASRSQVYRSPVDALVQRHPVRSAAAGFKPALASRATHLGPRHYRPFKPGARGAM